MKLFYLITIPVFFGAICSMIYWEQYLRNWRMSYSENMYKHPKRWRFWKKVLKWMLWLDFITFVAGSIYFALI